MSWPVWNPAQAAAAAQPEMMGLSGYTPEQWMAMQQQNWQQWSQWQQQYSEWQVQYGEKYTEQMNNASNYQAGSQQPPLPPAVPSEAPPPPPDGPPPAMPKKQPETYNNPSVTNSARPAVDPQTNYQLNAGQNYYSQNTQATNNNQNNRGSYGNASQDYNNTQNYNSYPNTQSNYSQQSNAQGYNNLQNNARNSQRMGQQNNAPVAKDNVMQNNDGYGQDEYEDDYKYAEGMEWNEDGSMKITENKRQPVKAGAYSRQSAGGDLRGNNCNTSQGQYNTPNVQNASFLPSTSQPPPNYVAAELPLTEEEKAFEIQFKSWEDEFLKWKEQNVNHPDKVAYREYEMKFETCRKQLMERKEQMKARRIASMTSKPPPPPPPMENKGAVHNRPEIQASKPAPQTNMLKDNNYYQNTENYDDYSYPDDYNNDSNSGFSSDKMFSRNDNTKGIPGLDLVEDEEKKPVEEPVIDSVKPEGKPDLSALSQGIKNILGDTKLLQMISMVSNPSSGQNSTSQSSVNAPQASMQANLNRNSAPGILGEYNAIGNSSNINQAMQQGMPPFNNLNQMPSNMQGGNFNNRPIIAQNFANKQNFPISMQQKGSMPNQMCNKNMQNFPPNQQPNNYNNFGFNNSNQPDRFNMNVGPMNQDLGQNSMNMYGRGGGPPMPPNNFAMGSNNSNQQTMQNPNMMGGQDVPVDPAAKKPSWENIPLIEPVTVIDYAHKPMKKPDIEFLEPVQTFDYGHQSSNKSELKDDPKVNLTWLELDNYQRKAGAKVIDYQNKSIGDSGASWGSRNVNLDYSPGTRYNERHSRTERFLDRDDRNYPARDDRTRSRNYERRGRDNRSRDRSRDRSWDRSKARRSRDRSRDRSRERNRDRSRDRSRDRRNRFDRRNDRNRMGEPIITETICLDSPPYDSMQNAPEVIPNQFVMIDDILEKPGRDVRPAKLAIILRGLPGSGKSYLAKLIKDKEIENGGAAPRILSIDDYFMSEVETDSQHPESGRKEKTKEIKYEYDKSMEQTYINSLIKSFKKTLTDGFFPFVIVDSVNDQLKNYSSMFSIAKDNGFKVYVCCMEGDIQTCFKRNIHNRTMEEIEELAKNWQKSPSQHILLDTTTLLQAAGIDHVAMEDVSDNEEFPLDDNEQDVQNEEEEVVLSTFSSKWDKMDDTDKLARLDGTSKPLRHTAGTMEDFLQIDDWVANKTTQPGKKTVRWADIEEKREQEKIRAIGFVVGQTDWQRMTDPTQGSSALTQTKYIERVKKN